MRHIRPRHHLFSGDVVQYRPEPPLPGVEAAVLQTGPVWVEISYPVSGTVEFMSLIPRYGPPLPEYTLRHGYRFNRTAWVPFYHLDFIRRDWQTVTDKENR